MGISVASIRIISEVCLSNSPIPSREEPRRGYAKGQSLVLGGRQLRDPGFKVVRRIFAQVSGLGTPQ